MDWQSLVADITALLKKWAPIIGVAVLPIVEAWLSNLPGVPAWVVTAVEAVIAELFPNNPAAKLRTTGITQLP